MYARRPTATVLDNVRLPGREKLEQAFLQRNAVFDGQGTERSLDELALALIRTEDVTELCCRAIRAVHLAATAAKCRRGSNGLSGRNGGGEID